MKKLMSLLLLGFLSHAAFASSDLSVEIKCSKGPYMVAVANSTIGGKGGESVTIPVFVLHKDNQVVGSGNLKLVGEGFEGQFVKGYIWGYESTDDKSVILVGVVGMKEPVPGTYQGMADYIFQAGSEVMEGTSEPCEVVIK